MFPVRKPAVFSEKRSRLQASNKYFILQFTPAPMNESKVELSAESVRQPRPFAKLEEH